MKKVAVKKSAKKTAVKGAKGKVTISKDTSKVEIVAGPVENGVLTLNASSDVFPVSESRVNAVKQVIPNSAAKRNSSTELDITAKNVVTNTFEATQSSPSETVESAVCPPSTVSGEIVPQLPKAAPAQGSIVSTAKIGESEVIPNETRATAQDMMVTPVDDIPEYPLPSDPRMQNFSFVPPENFLTYLRSIDSDRRLVMAQRFEHLRHIQEGGDKDFQSDILAVAMPQPVVFSTPSILESIRYKIGGRRRAAIAAADGLQDEEVLTTEGQLAVEAIEKIRSLGCAEGSQAMEVVVLSVGKGSEKQKGLTHKLQPYLDDTRRLKGRDVATMQDMASKYEVDSLYFDTRRIVDEGTSWCEDLLNANVYGHLNPRATQQVQEGRRSFNFGFNSEESRMMPRVLDPDLVAKQSVEAQRSLIMGRMFQHKETPLYFDGPRTVQGRTVASDSSDEGVRFDIIGREQARFESRRQCEDVNQFSQFQTEVRLRTKAADSEELRPLPSFHEVLLKVNDKEMVSREDECQQRKLEAAESERLREMGRDFLDAEEVKKKHRLPFKLMEHMMRPVDRRGFLQFEAFGDEALVAPPPQTGPKEPVHQGIQTQEGGRVLHQYREFGPFNPPRARLGPHWPLHAHSGTTARLLDEWQISLGAHVADESQRTAATAGAELESNKAKLRLNKHLDVIGVRANEEADRHEKFRTGVLTPDDIHVDQESLRAVAEAQKEHPRMRSVGINSYPEGLKRFEDVLAVGRDRPTDVAITETRDRQRDITDGRLGPKDLPAQPSVFKTATGLSATDINHRQAFDSFVAARNPIRGRLAPTMRGGRISEAVMRRRTSRPQEVEQKNRVRLDFDDFRKRPGPSLRIENQ